MIPFFAILPIFAGTSTQIELYATGERNDEEPSGYVGQSGGEPLCKGTKVDAMFRKKVDAAKSPGPGKTWVPNADLTPQEASSFAKTECTVKVGSEFWAHGPGWVKKVKIASFTGNASLSTGTGGGIHLRLDGKVSGLPGTPFFYTSVPFPSEKNSFLPASEISIAESTLSSEVRSHLKTWEPSISKDFEVRSRKLYKHPYGTLAKVEIHGKPPLSDYAIDWTSWVFATKTGAEILLHGDTDYGLGTGQMTLAGTLDVDGSGPREILLENDYLYVLLRQVGKKWQKQMFGRRKD